MPEVNPITLRKTRIICCVLLIEILLFIFSGTSFTFLTGDKFFSIEVDPVFIMFYLAKIPQLILQHQWLGILLEVTIIAFLLLLIRNPFDYRVSIPLFVLLMLFYVTLMGHLAHRNYQSGFFIILLPFLFKKGLNKKMAYEAVRYFILFFYLSAAILKISNNALAQTDHFSHLLSGQFTPYFLEGNTGVRTSVNVYLISHPITSYILFLCSFILELITVVGFFTKRFDKWLAVALLLFHTGNWFVMDIAPFGQIALVCMLFISNDLGLKKEQRVIL